MSSGVYRINRTNSNVGRLSQYKRTAVAPAGDWWLAGGIDAGDCVAAYQAKGAASYAASILDISGAGNNLTENNAPTWDDTYGWQFNGTDDRLTTSVGGKSVIIRFSNCDKPSGSLYNSILGYRPSSGSKYAFIIHPCDSADRVTFAFMRDINYCSGGKTSGVIAVSMSDTVDNHIYMDGTSIRSNSNTVGVFLPAGCFLGGIAQYPNYFRAVYIQALAIYSSTLTSTNVADLTTAMAAL